MNYVTHPYPGELIYSTVARFQRNMCFNSSRVNLLLFSSPYNVNNRECGYSLINLDRLSTNMGCGISGTQLIRDNTTYNYDTSFYRDDIKQKVESVYLNGGRPFKHFQHSTLRICPMCLQKDINIYGEPYFHVIHQLNGIYLCPYCHTPLINNISRDLFNYEYLDINEVGVVNFKVIQNHVEIAEMAREILENGFVFSYEETKYKLLYLLRERGALNGKTLSTDFINELIEAYQVDDCISDYYAINIDKICKDITKTIIKEKYPTVNTITYLILIHCLIGNVSNFNEIKLNMKSINPRPYKERTPDTILRHRSIVEDLINNGLVKTKAQLCKNYRSTYSCLICCDKDWLNSKFPPVLRNEINYNSEYDEEICGIVEDTYQRLLSAGQKISKSNLEKNPKLRTQIRVLDRLPISEAYVKTIIESTEQYDKRRIRKTINELIESGQNFTYFTIAKKAKVSMSRFEQLKSLVDEYLFILDRPKLKLYTGYS